VLRRTEGDVVHYSLMTLWDSWRSIERLRARRDRARYYRRRRLPAGVRTAVTHYEVLHFSAPTAASSVTGAAAPPILLLGNTMRRLLWVTALVPH